MEKSLRLLELTTGKDRSMRVVQFLLFTLKSQLPKGAFHDKVVSLLTSLSTSRQVLRLGVPISLWMAVVKTQKREGLTGLCSFRVSEAVLWLLYFAFDHLALICKIGLLQSPRISSQANEWSLTCWFYGDILSLFCDYRDVAKGVGDGQKLKLNLMRNATDLAVSWIYSVVCTSNSRRKWGRG